MLSYPEIKKCIHHNENNRNGPKNKHYFLYETYVRVNSCGLGVCRRLAVVLGCE